MTDQTGRPDDEARPHGTTPEPSPDAQLDRGDSAPESVLKGFSWDDPSGAAPVRPDGSTASGASAPHDDDHPAPDATTSDAPAQGGVPFYGDGAGFGSGTPSYGSSDAPQAPDSPAQYPPAAPYPPAPGAPSDPYGQASGQPYGQQPTPYAPQSTGYGQSAEYTATPQPYAYGPPPLSPDAEKARSNAILWTILNGVAIFLCGNLLAIGGVILAAVAIGKARVDVEASRNLTKWSWILFAVGFALALLLVIGFVALGLAGALGTATMNDEFSSL